MALTIPNTFADGEIITASEMNANFAAVAAKFGSITNSDVDNAAAINISKLTASKYELCIDYTLLATGTAAADMRAAVGTKFIVGGVPYDTAGATYTISAIETLTYSQAAGRTAAVYTLYHGTAAQLIAGTATSIKTSITTGTGAAVFTGVALASFTTSITTSSTPTFFVLDVTTQGAAWAANDNFNISIKLKKRFENLIMILRKTGGKVGLPQKSGPTTTTAAAKRLADTPVPGSNPEDVASGVYSTIGGGSVNPYPNAPAQNTPMVKKSFHPTNYMQGALGRTPRGLSAPGGGMQNAGNVAAPSPFLQKLKPHQPQDQGGGGGGGNGNVAPGSGAPAIPGFDSSVWDAILAQQQGAWKDQRQLLKGEQNNLMRGANLMNARMGRGLGGGFASLQGAALAQGQDALTKARLAFQQQQNQLMLNKQGAQSDYDRWKYGMEKGEFDTVRQLAENKNAQTNATILQLTDMLANSPNLSPTTRAEIENQIAELTNSLDSAGTGTKPKGGDTPSPDEKLDAAKWEEDYQSWVGKRGEDIEKTMKAVFSGWNQKGMADTATRFIYKYYTDNGKYPTNYDIKAYLESKGYKVGMTNTNTMTFS